MKKVSPQIIKPENGRDLDILIHRTEDSQSLPPETSFPELNKSDRREIYIAAASGNWSEASSYSKIHPHWWRVPLHDSGITALHVAVRMRKTSFVKKLVDNCTNIEDLENCKAEGNTAFCLAAITGKVKIAEILLRKNDKLLWIRDPNDMLPIQLASSAGHIPMTEFLFQAPNDLHNFIPFQDIVKLFFFALNNNIYSVASKLLERYPKLVAEENNEGLIPLQMLAQFSLFKKVTGHQDIVSWLFKGMEKENESLNNAQLSNAMFAAAKSGNITILKFLFKHYPYLLFEVDSVEQRNLLHIAILYRQETIYKLILKQGDSKNVMIQLIDFEDYNVLHLAGKMAQPEERFGLSTKYVLMPQPEERFGLSTNYVLMPQPEERFGLSTKYVLMREEEIWFREVQKIVPPAMQAMRNKDGLTPKELFYWSHKELHRVSASEMKAMANTLIVVATLIITLGITIALTIPIKDVDSTTTPFFRKKTWYTIFFFSVAFETCFCLSSMLFYASVILPPDLETKDELIHLKEKKIIFGCVSLFLSVVSMLITFISGATLLVGISSKRIPYFLLGLSSLVLVLHFALDYALWYRIVVHFLKYIHRVALEKLARLLWTIRKIFVVSPISQGKKA
ncbi:ankyrin repeat-containing protein At5g02620-like [Phaseolus vulgaris]|uniref:ankyrin repeat-containing protein At5g02620-like n=1 Tax=Phaseolus vulgaris TaxID=3885 RepID=UPI0035CA9A30